MQLPSYEKAIRLADRLEVLDQETTTHVPFHLNGEQRAVLRALILYARLVVVKGRQIGCSTVCAFFVMLLAIMNPGLAVAVVADEQTKAETLLAKIRGWLKQLGVRLAKDNVRSLVLPNGACIDALSAISHAEEGESRVGRSKSYGVIWGTEQAFWRHARAVWAALTSTAGLSARIIDESTGAPAGDLFEGLATEAVPLDPETCEPETEGDGYHRLFFGVEEHEAYRRDPNSIDDETWEELQKEYGFTRRDSAAWWHWKLKTDLNGDVYRALREYPVTMAHAFIYAQGRHIQVWTSAPVQVDGHWNHYDHPVDDDVRDEPKILGVDTATGVGKDASAMGLVGLWSGLVWSTYRCNTIEVPEFTQEVVRACDRYRPIAVVVETNGKNVGSDVHDELALTKGIPLYEQRSGDPPGEVYRRRARFKNAVESGEIVVGGHLLAEVKGAVIDEKKGTFDGPDDVINAITFARKWREENPDKDRVPLPDPTEVYVPPSVRRKWRQKRKRGRF